MNYFEFYGGDYLRDTTRLSLTDHGAFLRLLIAYYAEEEPLPAAHAELFTIAGATSSADKAAVRKIADKYFPVGADGLRHNGRADEEIEKAQDRIEGAQDKRSNETERQRRTRARRTALFADLRDLGIVPDGLITMAELKALHAAHVTRDSGVTDGVTGRDTSRDNGAVNTATTRHTPDPSNTPGGNNHTPSAAPAVWVDPPAERLGQFESHAAPLKPTPNPVAAFAIALSKAGVPCTAMNPDLIAYVAEGGTVEDLVALARSPGFVGKPATYVIRAARRMLAEAAQPITGATRHENRSRSGNRIRPSLADQHRADHERRAGGRPEPAPDDAIDGTAVRIPT
ncbi:YdaU family protein [Lysobacter capsici]|uniref:YdaU family protein n=1 Tax=Lysobacter capsici TaxID=435897 RepID=UPI001C0083EA|nr:YdaU family protein [Lysobacter capsici]QWF19279.1 YdaU family protein [Lysobacter capsici]